MVRRMTRQVDDLTLKFSQLEHLVVLEVSVKGIFEDGWVVKTVDFCKGFLDESDSVADGNLDALAKLLLQVLRSSEMVGVCVGFPEKR